MELGHLELLRLVPREVEIQWETLIKQLGRPE